MRDAKDIKRLRGFDYLTLKRMAENPNAPRVTREESILVTQTRKIKEMQNERKTVEQK